MGDEYESIAEFRERMGENRTNEGALAYLYGLEKDMFLFLNEHIYGNSGFQLDIRTNTLRPSKGGDFSPQIYPRTYAGISEQTLFKNTPPKKCPKKSPKKTPKKTPKNTAEELELLTNSCQSPSHFATAQISPSQGSELFEKNSKKRNTDALEPSQAKKIKCSPLNIAKNAEKHTRLTPQQITRNSQLNKSGKTTKNFPQKIDGIWSTDNSGKVGNGGKVELIKLEGKLQKIDSKFSKTDELKKEVPKMDRVKIPKNKTKIDSVKMYTEHPPENYLQIGYRTPNTSMRSENEGEHESLSDSRIWPPTTVGWFAAVNTVPSDAFLEMFHSTLNSRGIHEEEIPHPFGLLDRSSSDLSDASLTPRDSSELSWEDVQSTGIIAGGDDLGPKKYLKKYLNKYPKQYPTKHLKKYPKKNLKKYLKKYPKLYPGKHLQKYPKKYLKKYPKKYPKKYLKKYPNKNPTKYLKKYFKKHSKKYQENGPKIANEKIHKNPHNYPNKIIHYKTQLAPDLTIFSTQNLDLVQQVEIAHVWNSLHVASRYYLNIFPLFSPPQETHLLFPDGGSTDSPKEGEKQGEFVEQMTQNSLEEGVDFSAKWGQKSREKRGDFSAKWAQILGEKEEDFAEQWEAMYTMDLTTHEEQSGFASDHILCRENNCPSRGCATLEWSHSEMGDTKMEEKSLKIYENESAKCAPICVKSLGNTISEHISTKLPKICEENHEKCSKLGGENPENYPKMCEAVHRRPLVRNCLSKSTAVRMLLEDDRFYSDYYRKGGEVVESGINKENREEIKNIILFIFPLLFAYQKLFQFFSRHTEFVEPNQYHFNFETDSNNDKIKQINYLINQFYSEQIFLNSSKTQAKSLHPFLPLLTQLYFSKQTHLTLRKGRDGRWERVGSSCESGNENVENGCLKMCEKLEKKHEARRMNGTSTKRRSLEKLEKILKKTNLVDCFFPPQNPIMRVFIQGPTLFFENDSCHISSHNKLPKKSPPRIDEHFQHLLPFSKCAFKNNHFRPLAIQPGFHFQGRLLSGILCECGNMARGAKMRLGESSVHGLGVYLDTLVDPKSSVCEYVGEIVRGGMADLREKEYISVMHNATYLFALKFEFIIDATTQGNLARFINHSCAPNCAPLESKAKSSKILISAQQPLFPNHELFYNYRLSPAQQQEICHCQTKLCTGFM